MLTNGNLQDFFKPLAWGSLLYANMWEHILHGNVFADPSYASGEYFVAGNGQHVVYFGVMPVLVRAIGSLFMHNVYATNLTNVSMVCAILIAASALWYAIRKLTKEAGRPARLLGISIFIAVFAASPVAYLLAWSWTYHEVILWAVAWAIVFVCIYAVWVFKPHERRWYHGGLMGLATGMAMLCRPTLGLMAAIPFAALVVDIIITAIRKRQNTQLWLIVPGSIICILLAVVTMAVNSARWGNPLTFVKISQNIQMVHLYPERRKAIQKNGEFNIARFPASFLYYFVPSADNISKQPPFIDLDRKLGIMSKAPHYDYIEGSRLPLVLSMPYLLACAVLGLASLRRATTQQRWHIAWLLAGALVLSCALLCVYALSLRYTAEFVPPILFLGLCCIALLHPASWRPPRKIIILLAALFVLSVAITVLTTLAYKQFIWDIAPDTRHKIQEFIHYTPSAQDTKHIINNERFPVY